MELSKALYQTLGNLPYFYNSREPKIKPEKVDTSKIKINEYIGFDFIDSIPFSPYKDSIS